MADIEVEDFDRRVTLKLVPLYLTKKNSVHFKISLATGASVKACCRNVCAASAEAGHLECGRVDD